MKPFLTTSAAIALAASLAVPAPARAQEIFLGQVIPVAFTFCPRGFTEADGQLLPISSNTALFSLYGTTFGGDGRTTFALPDMRGRDPIHVGQGAGLQDYRLGQRGGAETHALTVGQMPAHTHALIGDEEAANSADPSGGYLAEGAPAYRASPESPVQMAPGAIANTGGGQAFNIRDPYLAIRWCVALVGIYPSRS
jgi:microcystin-dependent protein